MIFSMKNIKVQIFSLSLELLNLSTTKKRVTLLTIWQKTIALKFNQKARREIHSRNSKGTYDIFDLCTLRF